MKQPLPPLVSGAPIVGSLPRLLNDFPTMLADIAAEHPIARIKVLGHPIYIVSDPDLLQKVLRDDHKKFARGGEGASGIDRVIGNGLIALEGDAWLTERRLMQPYFHRRYLPRVVELMAETIDEQLDKLALQADGTTVIDMAKVIKRMTLTVFTRTMCSLGLPDEDVDALAEVIETAMRANSLLSTLEEVVPAFVPLPGRKTVAENVARFDEIVARMIETRRNSDSDDDDLLGMLMHASEDGETLTPQQLHDETKTLIIGGYDTTSGTLLWTLYMMAQHPEYVEQVRDEMAQQDTFTIENVRNLVMSRRIFDETTRMFPVSWANNRRCVEDAELGGYRVPAGSQVFMPILAIQRDERYWDDANTFKPERWEDKTGGVKHRFANLTFGEGPRVCLGEEFAKLEGTLIIAKFFERFDIKPLTEMPEKVTYDFTMAPEEAPMRLHQKTPIKA